MKEPAPIILQAVCKECGAILNASAALTGNGFAMSVTPCAECLRREIDAHRLGQPGIFVRNPEFNMVDLAHSLCGIREG